MSDFWIPQYKFELVKWLKRYDPTVNWKAKRKRQLLAIYVNLRKKGAVLLST